MKVSEKIGAGTTLVSDGQLKYITFDCFDPFNNRIVHCMSTRKGGVSTGECSSLNLGFNRNDSRENVIENYNRLCSAIGIETGSLVFSNQIHDNRIRVVTKEDRGKGFAVKSDITGYDGLMTNERGVTLVTFYADCVPVILYDPVKNAAALLHSGWRSTYKEISLEAVKALQREYGCEASDIIAAIGPSIGSCCFEVHNDVYDLMHQRFQNDSYYINIHEGKWKIDLQGIIFDTLVQTGVKPVNITKSGICTVCNKELFFSHRGDSGKTGSLAAFLQLL